MPKLPYLALYTGDWLKDPALTLCAPATRGVWIDLLAAMHELDRSGNLSGTAEQLARIARCSTSVFVEAVTDLQTTGAAEVVTTRNNVYVITNRRMRKEHLRRKSKEGKQKGEEILRIYKNKTAEAEYEIESAFELFWNCFPKGRKKSRATAREAFSKAIRKAPAAVITEAAKHYAESAEGRGAYVKMPTTWLNQECWTDDRQAWQSKDSTSPPKPREYSEITPQEFKKNVDADEFFTRYKDPNIEGRWFGQLKSGRKVETFTKGRP